MATCGHVPRGKARVPGLEGAHPAWPLSGLGPGPLASFSADADRVPPPRTHTNEPPLCSRRVSKPAGCGAGRRGALSRRDWPEGERGLHPASARGRPGGSEVEWSLVLLPQSPGMGTAGAAPRLAQQLGRGTSGLPTPPRTIHITVRNRAWK